MFKYSIVVAIALISCASLCLANGNSAGNCFANGSLIDPQGGYYQSFCSVGIGRPHGVCNCASQLASCNQLLSSCEYPNNPPQAGSFSPSIPDVLYLGESYSFSISIPYSSIDTLCFLRPFPQGLNFTQVSGTTPQNAMYTLAGVPSDTIPTADYGIAASRGAAEGGFRVFFSFAVQACSDADAVFPPGFFSTTGASNQGPCTDGNMECISSSSFSICDHGAWTPSQNCAPGTSCHPSGNQIGCY